MAIVTAVKSKSQRIAAFDILRGFFLLVILIDHIELYPSGYDLFTGRGRLMVSAAEGFFFMSGLLLGLVYKKRLALGMRFIFRKMWTRGLELYLISIVLTLLFTAAAFYLTHSFIKDGLFQNHNWSNIIWQTVQMRYSFGWADFLTRFAKLMVLAPIGFYLLAKRKWWILAVASAVAWGLRGESFTAAWQAIFFGGMVVGFYWQQIIERWGVLNSKAKSYAKRSLASLAALTFSFSWAGVFLLSLLNQKLSTLPAWLVSFTNKWNWLHNFVWIWAQKWTLGPLRIFLFLVWFWGLFMLVTKFEKPIQRYTRSYIDLLGKNSLFVYISHAFIIFIFQLSIIPHFTHTSRTNLGINFIITSAALAVQIAATVLYQRLRAINLVDQRGAKEKIRNLRLQTEGSKT
jgi:hypothetical protein